jgi:hypothetical protein
MSNLLLNDKPLIVLPSLAKKEGIGLNGAIILQQLHYWLQESKNIRDGHKWIYNTYNDWVDQFPFWSVSTIKRTISNLEKKGYIISANYNQLKIDNTKWYRINYPKLEHVNRPSAHYEQTEDSEWTDGQVNLSKPLPEITTDITSINSAHEESGGVPTTGIKIPLTSVQDDVEVIANRFIELRGTGFNVSPLDYNGIKEVLEKGVALENVLKWLEECFQKHQPKHSRDKIYAFNYCVPYILDRHAESTKVVGVKTVKKKSRKEDFNLND